MVDPVPAVQVEVDPLRHHLARDEDIRKERLSPRGSPGVAVAGEEREWRRLSRA